MRDLRAVLAGLMIVECFVENVTECEAAVRRVKIDELADAIREALRRRGVKSLVVPRISPKNGYRRASRPSGTQPDSGSPKRSSTAATAY
jgi:hypothetical protein